MAVREWNGISDQIILAPGGMVGYAGTGMWMGLLKRTSTSERTFCTLRNAAHSPLVTQSDFEPGVSDYISTAGFVTVGQAIPVNEWVLLAVTKVAGSTVPRFHLYRFALGTWAHANYSGSIADCTPLPSDGEVCLGNFNSSLWFQGLGGASAYFADTPDDATIEAAGFEVALQNWLGFGMPLAVWKLDQASTSDPVLDLTGGGADQTAISGTTVILGDDPPGFSFATGTNAIITVPAPAGAVASGLPPFTGISAPLVLTAGSTRRAWQAGALRRRWRPGSIRT